jgi:IMP dehydrogenase
VKALTLADGIMAGGLFSGSSETPGTPIEIDGKWYKDYNGSSTFKSNYVEGVKAIVPLKGKTEDILRSLLEGLKSGCSYQGVDNLEDLKKNPEFVKLTNSGLIESKAHDVIVK